MEKEGASRVLKEQLVFIRDQKSISFCKIRKSSFNIYQIPLQIITSRYQGKEFYDK